MPRQARSQTSKTCFMSACAGRCPRVSRRACTGSRRPRDPPPAHAPRGTRPAAVERLEAGHHDRHPVLRGDGARTPVAHHRARRGRAARKPCHQARRRARMASIAVAPARASKGRRSSRARASPLPDGHGVGGRGGLEATARRRPGAPGASARAHRVERRVEPCARPRRGPSRSAGRSCCPAPQHVAERR